MSSTLQMFMMRLCLPCQVIISHMLDAQPHLKEIYSLGTKEGPAWDLPRVTDLEGDYAWPQ